MSTTTNDFLRHLRTLAARQAVGSLSDQQLLERFRLEHSEASFAVLVQRHGPMVLSVCRRVLHHAQDVEDAFQATFLVLAKKATTLRQPPLLSGWLHGVAYHVALRLKAKAQRRTVHEHRIDPPPPRNAMDDITWRELRSVLDEELGKLSEKYRAPLVLCYLEARTQDEAARHLGWSKNTFNRRLNQARQLLARRLTRRGLSLPAVLTVPLLIDGTASATLPPLLVSNTVRAGLAWATGQAMDALASAQVIALAQGGAGSLLGKKASVAVVLLVSLTLGIGSLLAQRAIQSRTFAEAPTAPPVPATHSHSALAENDKSIEIKGRVLDPDGKPLVGAHLLLAAEGTAKKGNILARTTTDKDGLFRFTAQATDFGPQGKATLAAAAKGYGPDWIEVTTQNKDALTLHLVKDDVPVEGRVLDLEGRPVAGVRVHVAGFMQGDVDAWMEGVRKHRYPQMKKRINPEILGESVTAITGKDGRFRLTGLGRDRLMHVLLEGDNIERGDFEVVTRLELPKGLSGGNNGVYPARFDHLSGPAKSIAGTVRDKRTGKPIAGIRVACPMTPSWIWDTTDAQGRYRLTGVPKRKQYYVGAGGPPYFNCTKLDVVDTPGLEPITVDFALERGIAVRGNLLDKATGKPIRGRVSYVSLPDNPNLKDFSDLGKAQILVSDSGRTQADGSFTVVAVPGPGMLSATADDAQHYLRTEVKVGKGLENSIPEQWHTLVPIAPSEKDARSTVHDIALESARIRKGTVVGPDGKPLAGAHFAGLSGLVQLRFGRNDTLETASFTVGGLAPGGSRNLVFIHREKKLAKVQKVLGAEEGPLTVRLEPLGALAGRILDGGGKPRSKLTVAVMLSVQREDYKDLPLEILYDYPAWAKVLNREATTDAEGRFRIEGLVPGLKYLLNVKEDGAILESLTRAVAVESGKTKDLGDLKSKQTSDSGVKEKP